MGVLAGAARALNVSRPAIFYRVRASEYLQQVRDEAQEMVLDLAENRLLKAVASGQPWAVLFLLKTKGKKRGWVERQEIALPPPSDGIGIDFSSMDDDDLNRLEAMVASGDAQ